MEINFIVPSIKTGGGYRVIQELANRASEENRVIIHTSNDGTSNTFYCAPNVKIKKYGNLIKNKYLRMFNMLFMLYKLREKRCIVTGTVLFPFLFLFKNVYYYMQADDYHLFDDRALIKNRLLLALYHWSQKRAYQYKNVVFVFSSEWVYKRFLEVSGRKDVALRLISPAVNDAFFEKNNTKTHCTGNKKKIVIGTVIRRQPMKGYKDFVQAIHKLVDEGYELNVALANPGDVDSGWDEKWQVLYPKNDADMASFYRGCDIFISTSYWEGFGLPALEAMASGCVVITSNNGGSNTYARDRVNCLVYPPKDVDALVEKIKTLYENRTGEIFRNLQKNGVKTAREYSWIKSIDQFYRIIS